MEMLKEINILLLIFIALLLFRAWRGAKKGFVEEVNTLISLLAAFFVIALILIIVVTFRAEDYKNGTIAVLLLLMTGIILHLLGIVRKALRAIADLPVLRQADHLLGLAAGVCEAIVAAWIMYEVIRRFPTGEAGARIMAWTEASSILTRVCESNRLTVWLSALLS